MAILKLLSRFFFFKIYINRGEGGEQVGLRGLDLKRVCMPVKSSVMNCLGVRVRVRVRFGLGVVVVF